VAVDPVPATQPDVTAEEPHVTDLVDPSPAAPAATIGGAIVALPVAMASRDIFRQGFRKAIHDSEILTTPVTAPVLDAGRTVAPEGA
jgi:hypothetical protein